MRLLGERCIDNDLEMFLDNEKAFDGLMWINFPEMFKVIGVYSRDRKLIAPLFKGPSCYSEDERWCHRASKYWTWD